MESPRFFPHSNQFAVTKFTARIRPSLPDALLFRAITTKQLHIGYEESATLNTDASRISSSCEKTDKEKKAR